MLGEQVLSRCKQALLRDAVKAVLDDPTDADRVFHLVKTSRYVMTPCSGLVWSEVREAIDAAYQQGDEA